MFVLEEYDELLKQMSPGKTFGNKIPLIHDKTSHNMFLDNIDRGFTPGVILIMTSNKSPEDVCADPAFLREGRIHLKIKFDKEHAE